MSDAASPVMSLSEAKPDAVRRPTGTARNEQPTAAAETGPQGQIAELRVSGHLMTLETGLFCVFQAPGGPLPDPGTGLPGVRISLPPGLSGRPEAVSISTFRQDGWLAGAAALVRVTDGPGQVLVTVYQSPRPGETAPRLQVLRLSADPASGATPAPPPPQEKQTPAEPEIVAHVQRTGDVGVRSGERVGVAGSKLWIEGFGIAPREGIPPADIEYQAVLGRGWLSPWVEAGKFCGSRGMALPLLGLKLRLKGEAAKRYDCTYMATFTDGSEIGPVPAGEPCEAESLAALESFQIDFHFKGSTPARKPAGKISAAPKPAAPVKPASTKGRPAKSR
jgi:Clostridial hydrophobic W